MYNKQILDELKRLNFEDLVWLVYMGVCLTNIYGNYNDKEYLKTNNKYYQDKANKIFVLTFSIVLLIYIYFFIRNYKMYKEAPPEEQQTYFIRLLGSSFLIVGALCLIYFQKEQL